MNNSMEVNRDPGLSYPLRSSRLVHRVDGVIRELEGFAPPPMFEAGQRVVEFLAWLHKASPPPPGLCSSHGIGYLLSGSPGRMTRGTPHPRCGRLCHVCNGEIHHSEECPMEPYLLRFCLWIYGYAVGQSFDSSH